MTRPTNDRRNTALCWLLTLAVAAVTGWLALRGRLTWTIFGVAVVAVAVLPALVVRDPTVVPPWELVALAALPVFGLATAVLRALPRPLVTAVTYVSVATLSLLLAVHLHGLTDLSLTPRFAVVFVVATTMAVAAVWTVFRWVIEVFLAADALGSTHAVMEGLFVATVAGVAAGVVFVEYVGRLTDGLDALEGDRA